MCVELHICIDYTQCVNTLTLWNIIICSCSTWTILHLLHRSRLCVASVNIRNEQLHQDRVHTSERTIVHRTVTFFIQVQRQMTIIFVYCFFCVLKIPLGSWSQQLMNFFTKGDLCLRNIIVFGLMKCSSLILHIHITELVL